MVKHAGAGDMDIPRAEESEAEYAAFQQIGSDPDEFWNPAEGPRCHGEGEIEVGTVQDEFGNWDTETYRCPGCPDCNQGEDVTTTRTTTHTNTYTREETAVLAAIERRFEGRRQDYEMERIFEIVHEQASGKVEWIDGRLIDVPDWLTPVIVGQLIERGLVYRTGKDPESYTRA